VSATREVGLRGRAHLEELAVVEGPVDVCHSCLADRGGRFGSGRATWRSTRGSSYLLCGDGRQAEAVQELLLSNPRRIEQGEQGNLAFGVHRSTDNSNEFWLYVMVTPESAYHRS
jgi:hypothetical protein